MSRAGDSATAIGRRWDARYATLGATGVSWFQSRPTVSLELIAQAGVDRSAALIDVGGGASTLVDALVAAGWSDITVLDVSDVALSIARDRIGADPPVQWIEHDVLSWQPARRYDVWHDRAVFHFLVDEADRRRYRAVLDRALTAGAAVILGTFAGDGPTRCSGLPVARYDEAGLVAALGGDLDLVASRHEEHVTPAGGLQPFTWVALRPR